MLVIEKDFNYFHISAPERYQFVKQKEWPGNRETRFTHPLFLLLLWPACFILGSANEREKLVHNLCYRPCL